MRLPVLRVHPGPGIVAHRQPGQDHGKPGDLIVLTDLPAAAVRLDRLDHGTPPVGDQ
jgi:hypothetical protein